MFTSLPILVVGVFEQDVSANHAIQYPHLYEAGPKNALFSYWKFIVSLFRGTYHSLVMFFVVYLAYRSGGQVSDDLRVAGGEAIVKTESLV